MFQCGVTKMECSFSSYCKHLAMWPSLLSYYKSKNGFAAPVVYSSRSLCYKFNLKYNALRNKHVKSETIVCFFSNNVETKGLEFFHFNQSLSSVRYWGNLWISIFFHIYGAMQSNCTNQQLRTVPWSSWKKANKTRNSTRKMSGTG